jgi:uncharacterized protein (TIGR00290 family)
MYAIASSGGKDSTLALYRAQQSGFAVTHLFHIYNTDTTRVRFHGYKPNIVEEQAKLLGLESIIIPTRSQDFDNDFRTALETVKHSGLKGIIFGNIFLGDVREFYETRVRSVGLEYHDTLWGQSTKSVLESFVQSGFKAVVTSIWLKKLDRKYLGREINGNFLEALEKEAVDVCGENGEYHSLTYDGPCFKKPLRYRIFEIHEEMENIFLDVRIAQKVTE